METKDKSGTILDMICPHCHVALMYVHPENPKYLKCCLCGYCESTSQLEKSWIVKKPDHLEK